MAIVLQLILFSYFNFSVLISTSFSASSLHQWPVHRISNVPIWRRNPFTEACWDTKTKRWGEDSCPGLSSAILQVHQSVSTNRWITFVWQQQSLESCNSRKQFSKLKNPVFNVSCRFSVLCLTFVVVIAPNTKRGWPRLTGLSKRLGPMIWQKRNWFLPPKLPGEMRQGALGEFSGTIFRYYVKLCYHPLPSTPIIYFIKENNFFENVY